MADGLYQYSTNRLDKTQIGEAVDVMMQKAKDSRLTFERRWYDNNFFDDGYHFRYFSRTQNKIVDLSERSTIWSPMRSIPKASRQIRGVANLLASRNYVPVVYPERVSTSQYPPIPQPDPQTGQMAMAQNPEYKQALEEAKRVAKMSGHFLMEEWKKQNLIEKIALMIILAAKHGVSYLQVWPDAIEEAIKTQVYDAFDIFLIGSYNEIDDCPYIIKTKRRLIAEIKADERFELENVLKIHPDNRHASSDIKEAYERARRGGFSGNPDQAATVIEKEAFIKEYLNDDNWDRVRQMENAEEILKGKKKGDPVMRHTFAAGNITLKDEYVNLPGYPIVDLRFEPGPIYQVPLIERFIPSNKSLDLAVSRVERFLHTMVTGSYSIKSGESAEPNNTAGGQIFKYNTTPPIQNAIASVPPFVFNFMELLTSLIEEQGVTTSALGKLPAGVKANAAIETLKESEFANLAISLERVKGCIQRIAEKMLDHVDNYWMKPQTYAYLEKGEPQYFDIIGSSAISKREQVGLETPQDIVPIKKEYRVDINVEAGLAYTREGQKAAAKELGDYMLQLAQIGLLSPDVVKLYVEKLLETYGFGATQEIMEAMENSSLTADLSEDQITKIKLAVLEALKDAGEVGQEASERRVDENKLGTLEALKESGMAEAILGDDNQGDPKTEAEIAKIKQEMEIKAEEHQLKMAQMKQEMEIKAAQTSVDLDIKKEESEHARTVTEATTAHDMKMKEAQAKSVAEAAKQKSKEGGKSNAR